MFAKNINFKDKIHDSLFYLLIFV